MEIINTYGETLAHYRIRLGYAEDELNRALAGLRQMKRLVETGWDSKAGRALTGRIDELEREVRIPLDELNGVLAAFARLEGAIEEEIRLLAEADGETPGPG